MSGANVNVCDGDADECLLTSACLFEHVRKNVVKGYGCAQKLNVILPMSFENFFISGPSKTSSGMIPK